jgi:hypothetical protein
MLPFYLSLGDVQNINLSIFDGAPKDLPILPRTTEEILARAQTIPGVFDAPAFIWSALIQDMPDGGNRLGCVLALACLKISGIKIDPNADPQPLKKMSAKTPDLTRKLVDWMTLNRL